MAAHTTKELPWRVMTVYAKNVTCLQLLKLRTLFTTPLG